MANSDTIQSDVGVIGLDVIGRNVAQRLAERDFNVAAYDGGLGKTLVLPERTAWAKVRVAGNVSELMAKLRQPRTILIFSGADTPLSSTLDQLLPELEREDLVVDAGNSYFKDTASHGRRL